MARTTSAPAPAAPISLAALKQAADTVKNAAKAANTNGDSELSTTEINAFRPRTPDASAIRKALHTFSAWSAFMRESSGPQPLSAINNRIDAACAKAKRVDEAGPPPGTANGIIDEGKEYNALKRLKSFQSLAALVKPE